MSSRIYFERYSAPALVKYFNLACKVFQLITGYKAGRQLSHIPGNICPTGSQYIDLSIVRDCGCFSDQSPPYAKRCKWAMHDMEKREMALESN